MTEHPQSPEELPHDDGEGAAAVDAAQQIIDGPMEYIRVPRATWLATMALLREAVRKLEAALDEASTQQGDDHEVNEK